MNKNATSLCLSGCLSERGVPLRPRVAGVQEALGGLTCGPLPSSEASALHRLLGSVQDAVSIHLLASSRPWGLILEAHSLKMSVLELWFYEAAVDVFELQMVQDLGPCLANLGGCVPHLAKIYLMLKGSPQEHRGLSPGRVCFPVSRLLVLLHFQLQMPQRVEPCLRSVSWGPSCSSSGWGPWRARALPTLYPGPGAAFSQCLFKCVKHAALVKRTVPSPAHIFPTEHCHVCPVMSNSLGPHEL